MSARGRVEARKRRRVLAVVLGLAAAVLVAEGVLRATGFGRYAPREDHYALITLDPDPARLHWGFDPERTTWHAWDGDPYGTLPPGARLEYDDVNAAGLRGPLPPDDGTPRVLFVGDSFTFGEGVVGADTFVARVGDALASDADPPTVLNAGVPGYGTFEEARRLPALLDRFAPSVVVVVFTPNDPIHVSASKAQGNDLLRPGEPRNRSPLRVLALLRRALSDETERVERWYLDHYVGARSDAWEAARSQLLDMRALCVDRGVPFGVAYFPLLHRLDEAPLAPIEGCVREACERASVPYLDLTPAFAGLDERDLWVHPVDHHPNARAHAAAAAALVPFVRDLLAPR